MTILKKTFATTIVLLLGFMYLTPYKYMTSSWKGLPAIYKINRITGTTWLAIERDKWERIN